MAFSDDVKAVLNTLINDAKLSDYQIAISNIESIIGDINNTLLGLTNGIYSIAYTINLVDIEVKLVSPKLHNIECVAFAIQLSDTGYPMKFGPTSADIDPASDLKDIAMLEEKILSYLSSTDTTFSRLLILSQKTIFGVDVKPTK